MDEKIELYFPSAQDMDTETIDLFGARFPMAIPSLATGEWNMTKGPVPKGKHHMSAPLRLVDGNERTFNGTATSGTSKESDRADLPTQQFALIPKGDKTYAIPVDWFYVFKPARKAGKTSEEGAAMRAAATERETKLTKTFNKRFHIKDEEDDEKKRVKAVSQVDAVRKAAKSRKQSRHGEDEDDAFRAIEPEIDALFAMDEQLAEGGWDFEDDVANNDLEVNVNREEAEDAQEEEEAELEREHEELEKVLKKEGRVGKEEKDIDEDEGYKVKDEDEGYKIDLDEDEVREEEELPAVAASRRLEQEAEKEDNTRMNKLRKRVKHKNALLMSGMMAVNDDSDDSLDSEDDDSEDPGSRQQSPAANGGASTSTGAGARAAGENKRERPEDMKDKFVAVKRANVPLASLPPTRERSAPSSARATPNPTEVPANVAADGTAEIDFQNMKAEQYSNLVDAVKARWPADPLGQPLTQRKLKDIIDVVKQAFLDVHGTRLSKPKLIKPLLQLATKGGAGKDAMFKSSGKGPDGKSTFNLNV